MCVCVIGRACTHVCARVCTCRKTATNLNRIHLKKITIPNGNLPHLPYTCLQTADWGRPGLYRNAWWAVVGTQEVGGVVRPRFGKWKVCRNKLLRPQNKEFDPKYLHTELEGVGTHTTHKAFKAFRSGVPAQPWSGVGAPSHTGRWQGRTPARPGSSPARPWPPPSWRIAAPGRRRPGAPNGGGAKKRWRPGHESTYF